MFDALKKMFAPAGKTDDADAVLPDGADPQNAAAALLVETAQADDDYEPMEKARIIQVLSEAFSLDEATASEVLRNGEKLVEIAAGAHQFTTVVKTLEEEKRVLLIEGLFFVAFTDGTNDMYEDAFIRHVASLLHIEDRDRALARQRAQARLTG